LSNSCTRSVATLPETNAFFSKFRVYFEICKEYYYTFRVGAYRVLKHGILKGELLSVCLRLAGAEYILPSGGGF
jgi:hypothetical protein